jgi:RNA polymerase sigma factor (sigma-70 family)
MNDDVMQTYETLFSSTEKRVRKFKREYINYFPDSYMGLDDLQQEIKITIFEGINKFAKKDPADVMKLCNIRVGWRLLDLLREGITKQKHFINQTVFEPKTDEDEEGAEKETNVLDVIQRVILEDKATFKLAELLAILTDFEYNMLREILLEKKQLSEIAEEHKCSPQYIQKIYSTIKTKVKQYVNNKRGVKK